MSKEKDLQDYIDDEVDSLIAGEFERFLQEGS